MTLIQQTFAREVKLEKLNVGLKIRKPVSPYKRADGPAGPLIYTGRKLRFVLWKN